MGISTYVVVFPALDAASAYPLNAITLGNSLQNTFRRSTILTARNLSELEIRVIFRLVAACPPFLLVMFVTNLEKITAYSGLTGFSIMLIVPALLAYSSKSIFKAQGSSIATSLGEELQTQGVASKISMIVLGVIFTVLGALRISKIE